MLKNITTHCPTKDKTVSLVVNYIFAGSLEDGSHVHIKGIIRSCTGNTSNCNKCELYDALPKEI